MNEPLQRVLTPRLQRWLRMIADRPSGVATTCVALTVAALVYAFFFLGINADNLSLVSKSLESRRNHAAFAALFPNLEEAMLVVVDGETPALAREATEALAAELDSAAAGDVAERGIALWLTGSSQADECNPVFYHLRAAGVLAKDEYRARYELALDARRFPLARYLARGIDEETLEQANRWVEAERNPEALLDDHALLGIDATGIEG